MTFTAADALPAGTKVRYRLSGEIVGEEPVSGTNWTWKAPSTDFKGYMAELYRQENGTDVIVGTIAVDVSSHPARFPRYGFVADFDGDKTEEKTLEEMAYLNRHHINWVQFQDWQTSLAAGRHTHAVGRGISRHCEPPCPYKLCEELYQGTTTFWNEVHVL